MDGMPGEMVRDRARRMWLIKKRASILCRLCTPTHSKTMDEQEFKKKLNPEQYRIMRQKGKEPPFSGKHWDNKKEGVYACAACGSDLFSSSEKFDAGNGYPSFRKPIDEKKLEFKKEPTGDNGWEIRCKNCHSHLGYAVADKQKNFYRINSASLNFEEDEEFEIEQPDDDKKADEKKKEDTTTEPQSPQTILLVIGGIVVGMIIGAGGGYLICQNLCANPLLSVTAATTTATTTRAATTTHATSTSGVIPRGTATSSSGALTPASSGLLQSSPRASTTTR